MSGSLSKTTTRNGFCRRSGHKIEGDLHPPDPDARINCYRCFLPDLTGLAIYRRRETSASRLTWLLEAATMAREFNGCGHSFGAAQEYYTSDVDSIFPLLLIAKFNPALNL